jgi:glutaredoxin
MLEQKDILYVKAGCPFSYKFLIYLNETNHLSDFEVKVAHADEGSYKEIASYLKEKTNASPSFPTVETTGGDFISGSDELIQEYSDIYKIPRENIKMIDYWEANMMPRMRNIMKQLREVKAKLADV